MALSIKTQEADRLARELAAAAHGSITEAVAVALRERLARVRTLPGPDITTATRLLAVDFKTGSAHDPDLTTRPSGMTSMACMYDVHRCGHLCGDGHRPRRAGADWLSRQMQAGERRLMSTGSALELGLVLESRTTTLTALDALLSLQIELTSFDEAQFGLGLRAWRKFGRGRDSASLNFGDCFGLP